MADCSRIENLLGEYIDGELSGSDFIDVENHLSVCANCRAELAALRMLITASSEIEAVQPPTESRMRIAAATTRKERGGGLWIAVRERFFSFRPIAWAGGAGLAALALMLVVSFGRISEPTKQIATQPKPAVPVTASPTLPQTAPERIASAEPIPAKASVAAPRTLARRVASKKSANRPAVIAFVPKTIVVPKT